VRRNEGVEWALHSCVLLAWLEDQVPISTSRLANAYELPAATPRYPPSRATRSSS
jgi:hypothetical protein